jgi:hypothetical protein
VATIKISGYVELKALPGDRVRARHGSVWEPGRVVSVETRWNDEAEGQTSYWVRLDRDTSRKGCSDLMVVDRLGIRCVKPN